MARDTSNSNGSNNVRWLLFHKKLDLYHRSPYISLINDHTTFSFNVTPYILFNFGM